MWNRASASCEVGIDGRRLGRYVRKSARREAEEELAAQLARLPDLGQALREAPAPVKRQVFESFELQIAYDKAERRVELTATVSEAVADAFENAEALLAEGSDVVVRDIAGARFVSRYHPRIVERARLAG